MKRIGIGGGTFTASAVSLGCMRISGMENKEASTLLHTALDQGIDFFDHADIYGGGKSEEVFAKALPMNADAREKIFIQSKCGIRKDMYDFSKEHILSAVEGSLKRLDTEYLDVLLLHRPDTLMDPQEVAEAFSALHAAGKVRYFGVSNQNPYQMQLLQKYVGHKLLINQLQFSLAFTGMVDAGLQVNTLYDGAVVRDGGILEYCRLNDITIQPWSPFQYGFFEGVFLDNPKFPELNAAVSQLAQEKGVENTAIALAWILRHPAHMQPIVGTTNAKRLEQMCKGVDVELTREEWYRLYLAAGNQLP